MKRLTRLVTALVVLTVALVCAVLLVKWKVHDWDQKLADDNEGTRVNAAKALGSIGPLSSSAVPGLIRALKSTQPLTKPYTGGVFTPWDHGPGEARQALIHIGAAAVPGLTQALEDEDALTRVNAAWALWAITKDTKPSLPVLLKAWRDRDLDTQDECIRIDATSAIGEMATDNPDLLYPIIVQTLTEDPEMGYEVTQTLTIMAQKDERAVVQLFKLMSSDGENLYRFAAFGLRKLKSVGVPLLIDGLKSDNTDLRWRCAWALGGMKSEYAAPAAPALKVCQNDRNEKVRKWADWALDNIQSRFFDRYYD